MTQVTRVMNVGGVVGICMAERKHGRDRPRGDVSFLWAHDMEL